MNSSRDIRDILQQLGPTNIELFDMEVVSVNENDRTASCTNGINEVVCRLMASVDDGLLHIPEVGTTVVVLLSKTVDPLIILYSGIEKTIMRGGQFEGLVKVIELTEKLNNLENKVNTLINTFNNHTHILTLTVGTGTAAPTVTPVTGTLTPTQQADIENDKITHG